MSQKAPKSSTVYRGCVLATIFDSLYAIFGSTISRCWDSSTYVYDAGDGDSASIAFRGASFVASAFNHESLRSPFPIPDATDPDVECYFRTLPEDHRDLVEPSMYLRTQHSNGTLMRLITTAFWDDGEYVGAAEPWEQVWQHGAAVLHLELIEDLETAFDEFCSNYGLGPRELALARSLFERKIARPDQPVVLQCAEVEFLESGKPSFLEPGFAHPLWQDIHRWMAKSLPWVTGIPREKHLADVRQNLAAVGIYWPG